MGEKLSTWDREAITGMIADAAENVALCLTPPELASSPAVFQRADGSSVFRPKHATVFSSEMLVAVEDRLLDRAHALTAPAVTVGNGGENHQPPRRGCSARIEPPP